MRIHSSERSRHLLLRGKEGDTLPRSVVRILEDQGITSGWLRGGGVLTSIELRTYGERPRTRHLRGPAHLVSLDGSIGQLAGRVSVGLRAVLVYDTDHGVETVAGEIVNADVVALEAFVTAFDDLRIARELDERSGSWMLAAGPSTAADPAPASPASPAPAAPAKGPTTTPAVEVPAGWGAAIAASAAKDDNEEVDEAFVAPRKGAPTLDALALRPRAGDFVEHFAFGRCEVLKADGDRIKIKVPKDGRIREIALSALRVTPIEGRGPKRSFRLERRTE